MGEELCAIGAAYATGGLSGGSAERPRGTLSRSTPVTPSYRPSSHEPSKRVVFLSTRNRCLISHSQSIHSSSCTSHYLHSCKHHFEL